MSETLPYHSIVRKHIQTC